MAAETHWLLPINPAAHGQHMPADWRTREDATAVWEAIGRSQPADRWCLRTGYRTMRAGDTIWAYLSQRQELCATGAVREVVREGDEWFVLMDWDVERTAQLCRTPIPREVFRQVPMSVSRAGEGAVGALRAVSRRTT